MTLRDAWSRLDRFQRGRLFKIVASAVLTVAAIAGVVAYTVAVKAAARDLELRVVENPDNPPPVARGASTSQPSDPSSTPPAPAAPGSAEKPPADPNGTDGAARAAATAAAQRSGLEKTVQGINTVLAKRADPTAVAIGAAAGLGVALVIVWLGVGITYLALGLLAAAVIGPLRWMGFEAASVFLAGAVALTAAFTALMQGLKLLLSVPAPRRVGAVLAIARNVVDEAVRMKVSIVFIVLLIFALAALPGNLDPTTPLRYRVQSFLQYGAGGSFWIIAVLTVFLAVGTVAFEQRDRVIWQTMTKPVAPWQYLLGKWLGVVGVAAVLLAVSTSGVFLFTEYLRGQKAVDEREPYVAAEGRMISEDRLVLETQVLAARRVVEPVMDPVPPEQLEKWVGDRIARERQQDDSVRDAPEVRSAYRTDIQKELVDRYRTVAPAVLHEFKFHGLEGARDSGSPITLRYRVDAEGNDPRLEYRITLGVPGSQPVVRAVPLGQMVSMPLSAAAIDQEGTLTLIVANADVYQRTTNAASITFPPGGLEVYYSDGSYRANFARVMIVLWLKLCFLAMVGVTAATFLSFSVASMVSFGVFLCAEGAAYLSKSLQYYDAAETNGKIVYYKVLVRAIALPIAGAFRFYADLRPTANLVEGRLFGWGSVGLSVLIVGAVCAALYGIGIAIFRRRELAVYSGR